MPTWSVFIPLTGVLTIEVEAKTKSEAIEAAWSKCHSEGPGDDYTWEAVDHTTTGNVFHGELNDVDAQEHK